jgi:hypothetical protein
VPQDGIEIAVPRMSAPRKRARKDKPSGKLRIGDDWNAINIIALSQSNPLKAVAEFVENSIDANARNITITRGREQGDAYLRIRDDGDGIPVDEEGKPNFRYVATHICDSIKRQLKADGARGIQGEFGIGLLSFWTVGKGLTMTTAGADGKTYQMHMQKGSPNYTLNAKRTLLFPESGTELTIKPLLAGVRQLNGDKIQWYLASELRDRIRNSGVSVKVIDRTARKEYKVEPRQFSGRLLHQLPQAAAADGEIYTELYLSEPDAANAVGLYRSGTRVLGNLAELDAFAHEPWTSGSLQGIVDASFLNLTPGTRTGVVLDDAFERFRVALEDVEAALIRIIAEQRRAEDERASRKMLNTIRKAFREALPRNTTGSRSRTAVRGGERGTAGPTSPSKWKTIRAERRWPASRPRNRANRSSFSSMRAPCSASAHRRSRAFCPSANRGPTVQSRATGRASRSITISISSGASPKVPAAWKTTALRSSRSPLRNSRD